MKFKKEKEDVVDLVDVGNFLDYGKKIDLEDKTFEKLMFVYSIAIRELETKLETIKEEYKVFYEYDLIDHVVERIKSPESILEKMKRKNCKSTYREMIENINDIAGVRIICPLKKDIFSIRNLVCKLPGVNVLKEKDYVTKPKDSGYSSYHVLLEVPISLSQKVMYVKVEVQIRTLAMDFWANLEHKIKYKPEKEVNKKVSKDLVTCAKVINKLDSKMMLMNT